jgi:hypothetical protein
MHRRWPALRFRCMLTRRWWVQSLASGYRLATSLSSSTRTANSKTLLGPISESNGLGGEQQHTTIGYWPRLNGEFTFRVVQLDGSKQSVLAERRAVTDSAVVTATETPATTPSDGRLTVTGLRTDPGQPVVGEPVEVHVDAANLSSEPVTLTVPVLFVDDAGQQLLATGTFTLVPASFGTGQVTWIPQRATTGLLEAGEKTVPITVVDSLPATPADTSDQAGPPGSPSDDNPND